MANENKKINELVAEDDDTAELEALTVRRAFARADAAGTESDEDTCDFDDAGADDGEGEGEGDDALIAELKSDLKRRSETIERLQFDVQQLHSKWLGLETEIGAREELTSNLRAELDEARQQRDRKAKLLQKRDQSIKSLKSEIREREQAFRELETRAAEAESAVAELEASGGSDAAARQLAEYEGMLASQSASVAELSAQQARTERYADELRRQLADLQATTARRSAALGSLESSLADARQRIDDLEAELREARAAAEQASAALSETKLAHEQEIRNLRFELGEAAETLAEHETISEQLASDLVETRNFKAELERMLSGSEEKNAARVAELEGQVKRLEATVADYEDKLETKSNAINCLLQELARKSHEIESIGEMENVIHDLGDRMSERFDDRPPASGDRVTRLLVGRIDDQELRFPLFKDRLTIGRTQQNDIQLKAHYISRRHAVVLTEGDATRVIDWGSKNGVYVNSNRVTEHFLKNGDIVTIGTAKFRYEERPKRDS